MFIKRFSNKKFFVDKYFDDYHNIIKEVTNIEDGIKLDDLILLDCEIKPISTIGIIITQKAFERCLTGNHGSIMLHHSNTPCGTTFKYNYGPKDLNTIFDKASLFVMEDNLRVLDLWIAEETIDLVKGLTIDYETNKFDASIIFSFGSKTTYVKSCLCGKSFRIKATESPWIKI